MGPGNVSKGLIEQIDLCKCYLRSGVSFVLQFVNIITLGSITNDGNDMPPFIFIHSLTYNMGAHNKHTEEALLNPHVEMS